jgi:hypothetical protein
MGLFGLAVLMGVMAVNTAILGQDMTIENELSEVIHSRTAQSGNSIVGVWEATVTPRNCQTGDPVGPPFQSLVTMHEGGTMSEYGANPATPFRSNGQGFWERGWRGEGNYYQRFVFFPLTPAGIAVGKVKVTQTVDYNRHTDEFTSSGSFQLFNPAGVVINTGCSTATGIRFR